MLFLIFIGLILYLIGVFGIFINRKNFIIFLMCLEMLFISTIFIFSISSLYLDSLAGQIFALFIIAVAAAESAIGLSILVSFYQLSSLVDLDTMDLIKF